MLAKSGLQPAENWIFSDGFAERLRFEIDPAWQGDIPRTLLISRDGKITTIEGSAEIADLENGPSSSGPRRNKAGSPTDMDHLRVAILEKATRAVRPSRKQLFHNERYRHDTSLPPLCPLSRACWQRRARPGGQGRRPPDHPGLEPGHAGRRQDCRWVPHRREQGRRRTG